MWSIVKSMLINGIKHSFDKNIDNDFVQEIEKETDQVLSTELNVMHDDKTNIQKKFKKLRLGKIKLNTILNVAIPLQNAHESENQEGISEEESYAHSPQKQHSQPAIIQIITNTEIMQSPATLPTNVLPSNAATMNKSKLFVMLKKKKEYHVCKLEASFEETKLSMDLFQQKLLDIKIAFEAKMNLLVKLEQDLKRTKQ
ncbi:hypothetical protein RFI_25676 [Reticulomyxa filosa]|uniref:Uncharacterized protein n=1 Tax=Reticulomyxa filosa TaxID=46433 RepID=X6MF78_RETFI|nr:hypothetical protein RFI_25676 [Reticulomyxa filosa]|eukprot:ETO11700.1 hypothetical protein RFI_25676 [Reticulomyxa filosa]